MAKAYHSGLVHLRVFLSFQGLVFQGYRLLPFFSVRGEGNLYLRDLYNSKGQASRVAGRRLKEVHLGLVLSSRGETYLTLGPIPVQV